jgi:uncharacterized protein with ATP-grasp and redox domains
MKKFKGQHVCFDCLAHSFTKFIESATEDSAAREKLVKKMAVIIAENLGKINPGDIGTLINRMVWPINRDPFIDIKNESNRQARKIIKNLKIKSGTMTFSGAIRLALVGNSFDYLVKEHAVEPKKMLSDSRGPAIDHSARLLAELKKAEYIMYLTDNTGEIFFDEYLIRYIAENINKNIIVCPKDSPIQNDATLKDLELTNISKYVVDIIPTGPSVGLNLAMSSKKFKKAFADCGMIIAKGMGYYENACHIDKNICFMLKAKCSPIAVSIGVKRGDEVVMFIK